MRQSQTQLWLPCSETHRWMEPHGAGLTDGLVDSAGRGCGADASIACTACCLKGERLVEQQLRAGWRQPARDHGKTLLLQVE